MTLELPQYVSVALPKGTSEEQAEVIYEFAKMLIAVTADGGRKRAAGLKPSWKVDPSHRAAIFSHLNKDAHGEFIDPDSGSDTFVHLAWRALAIAWQRTHKVKVRSKPSRKRWSPPRRKRRRR